MENTSNTFFSNLWKKKIPQYLGSYFAIGFGILQFIEFASKRYQFSSNIVDKYLLIWILLIPAIVILIYFNGNILGKTNTTKIKWPKYAVLGNVLIAFIVGGIFKGKTSAQYKDEIVQLVDEEGKQLQAVIPELNRIKSIACFQFVNKSNDDSNAWWSPAFSVLLQSTLNQRPEFYSVSEFELSKYYNELSLESFTTPTIGMHRKIAQKSRNDYFLRTSFEVKNDEYILTSKLYNTLDGKEEKEFKITDASPFIAIDKLSAELYQHYFGAFENKETQILLPSSSLITNQTEALKSYTESSLIFFKNPEDLESAINSMSKAIKADKTCAQCYSSLGVIYYLQKDKENALKHLKKAIKYGEGLPKRSQFDAKAMYYSISGNIGGYLKLLELRKNMFPYEFTAYEQLQHLYATNKGVDSTIVLLDEAIENGNIEKGLLAKFDWQLVKEDYNGAENTLLRLTKEFPDREQDKNKFVTLYRRQGNLDKAKKYLIELEALNPFDTEIQIDIAFIDFKNLEFKKAMDRINEGYEQADTQTDSLAFLWAKGYLELKLGKVESALEHINKYEALAQKQMPTLQVLQKTFFTKVLAYQSNGNNDNIATLIDDMSTYQEELRPIFKCQTSELMLREYVPNSLHGNAFKGCLNTFDSYGEGYKNRYLIYNAYLNNNYQEALNILTEHPDLHKSLDDFFLINLYKISDNHSKAITLAKKNIKLKTVDVKYYIVLAELLKEKDPDTARKHLSTALKFLEQADTNYYPLIKAKELEFALNDNKI